MARRYIEFRTLPEEVKEQLHRSGFVRTARVVPLVNLWCGHPAASQVKDENGVLICQTCTEKP